METKLVVRETAPADLVDILEVERRAFNSEEEAGLVRNMLDPFC